MKLPAEGWLTGRAVEEWIGETPDTPIPPRVKLRVFERHMGFCYLSGVKIKAGDDWDAEHVISLKAGGENRESNLRPALRMYHKTKTANERSVTAKIERTRKKHLGITSPKRPFGNTRYRKKVSGEVVERD